MSIKVTPTVARELVIDCMNAGLVPLVKSSPGMGKSAIIHEIAKERNLKVIDIRLAQLDPVELNGFPNFVNGKATYAPMDIFPTTDTPIPEGYDGWLLFFDELTSANRSVQAAAYKILLDNMVGQFNLHPNAFKVAAGNLSTDKAVVSNMSTALQSRMVHINMGMDHKGWVEWAIANGVDHRVIAYANFNDTHLYKFDPDHTDDTFACYRTWEFASKLIKNYPDEVPASKRALLAGTLSEGVGRDFFTFLEIYGKVVKLADVLANPGTLDLPDENGLKYATVSMLSNKITANNADKIIEYVTRMPHSFILLFIRMVYGADKSMVRVPEFAELIKSFKKHL